MTWPQLAHHNFWEGRLKHLIAAPVENLATEQDEDHNLITENNKNPLCFSRLSTDRPRTAGGGLGSIVLEQKPPEVNVSFSISSRLPASPQGTMQTRNPIHYKESDEQKSSLSANSVSTVVMSPRAAGGVATMTNYQGTEGEMELEGGARERENATSLNEYRRMFFLPSELNVSQIIDNPKVFTLIFLLLPIFVGFFLVVCKCLHRVVS